MASKSKNPTPATTRPAAPRTASPAAPGTASPNSTKTPHRPAPDDELIRARAYFLWEQAGCPDGDGLQFWLEAERELNGAR